MPRQKRCWSSWVYLSDGKPRPKIALTYWMNALQSLPASVPLFVTLNPSDEAGVESVLDAVDFEHPVYDVAMLHAQQRLGELQGRNGLWLCGAYHGYGFHEDGLASAVALAKQMGIAAPWHRS